MPYNGNTLVVDFDDTLCIHPHDDKSNIACGKPNYDLISEINRLFDKGFDIFTSAPTIELTLNINTAMLLKYG